MRGQGLFQGLHAELRVHGVGQPPCQNLAAMPIHDGYQIHKAPLHRDIRAARHGQRIPARIRLWRLVMRQSPEEGLSEALEALEVFDRPVPPVSEEVWAEINRLIAQLLTRPDPGKTAALARLAEIRKTWEGRGLASQLDRFAPLSPADIRDLAVRVGEIAVRLHLAGEEEASAAERVETANIDWLHACDKAGGFLFEPSRRDQSDPPRLYSGFWYASRQSEPPFLLPDMEKDREWDSKVALLLRRKHLAVPPYRVVQFSTAGSQTRDLRFFDHGDSIHDGLCKGWLGFGSPLFACLPQGELVVKVGASHPALEWRERLLLLTIAASRPPEPLSPGTMQDFASALDWFSASARQSYLARLDEGLTADRRWLQTLLPARFLPKASVLSALCRA